MPTNSITSYFSDTETFNLPTPTRDGYEFVGWYTTSDFSGSAVTQITKGTTGNKIYYAKWQSNNLVLYSNGDQYSDVTGGWNFSYSQNGSATINYSFSPTLYMNGTGTANYVAWGTIAMKNNVDVSPYNKFSVTVNDLYISNPNSGNCSSSVSVTCAGVSSKITSTGTFTGDISAKTGANKCSMTILGNCYGTARVGISKIELNK